jgi:hypothetical protein
MQNDKYNIPTQLLKNKRQPNISSSQLSEKIKTDNNRETPK